MFPIRASKRAFITLVVVAALLFAGNSLAYWNRAARVRTLKNEVKQKQDRLADSESIARRLTNVEQRYLDAQAQLGALEQGVSTKAYVPTLLRQLEELGRSVHLRVVGVRPRPAEAKPAPAPTAESGGKTNEKPKKPEPYDKLDMDLEVHGKYWDVVSFLYKITSFPKILAVNDLQISPVAQSSAAAQGSPMLSVRVNTTAFILKNPPVRQAGKSGKTGDLSRTT